MFLSVERNMRGGKMGIDKFVERVYEKYKNKRITKEILLEIVNDVEKFEDYEETEK